METVKKLIMLQIPTSICNFRCHYCYLSQRKKSFQGKQADLKYSPEYVAKALSPERMGGICFINACAEGETLLTKDIDKYFKALVEEGHYLEIVSNMTATPMIEKILSWNRELLSRVEFKCSFHFLELKQRNMLELFARNVNRVWEAGASANVEMVPSDELIPYINEIKQFSLKNFGALPQLTIARDDRTKGIVKLTELSDEEYQKTWESFNSNFWEFKKTIFGVKQTGFCYAGLWMISVSLASGNATACYYKPIGNIFENLETPLPDKPIGKCPIAHCFNGHAFMTFGLIPNCTNVRYGDIRNRIKSDGTEWLQPELKEFFNSRLTDNNEAWSKQQRKEYLRKLDGNPNLITRTRRKLSQFSFYQHLHDLKAKFK